MVKGFAQSLPVKVVGVAKMANNGRKTIERVNASVLVRFKLHIGQLHQIK